MASKRGVGKMAGAAAEGVMKPLRKIVKQGDEFADVAKKVDSKGNPIPPGVKRLPSGRRPANSRYAGQQYPMDKLPAKLQTKYPDGVKFTDDGFPDFGPYAQKSVKFDPPGFAGNHGSDMTEASRKAGIPDAPDGYTWHHHQDGHTMQLVPTDLHDAIRHAGGVAIKKGS